eukprot:COSAG02_NODE_6697_length_3415_cov_2.543727_5_plen_110_part_00
MDVGRVAAGVPVPHTPKSPVRPTEAEHSEVGKSASEAKVTDDTAAATAAANESGTDAMVATEDQRQDTSVDKLSLRNQLQDLSLQLTNASLLGDADNVTKITARITQVT